jgi:hypothetical protein
MRLDSLVHFFCLGHGIALLVILDNFKPDIADAGIAAWNAPEFTDV